jgi:hypothetical protein
MTILSKNSVNFVAAVILLPFLITSVIIPYEQHHHHLRFIADGGECIDYEASENINTIDCNASFLDVVQTINDPDILQNTGAGEYILSANLEVANGIAFEMTSSYVMVCNT